MAERKPRLTPAEVAAMVPGVKLGSQVPGWTRTPFTESLRAYVPVLRGDTDELREQYSTGEIKSMKGWDEWL